MLRLLAGENISELGRELGASTDRLTRWKQQFVDAGDAALAKKKSAFQSRLWKHRKLALQWAGVVVALILTVYFLTRFFESGGSAAAP